MQQEELWRDIERKTPILAEIMCENGSQTVYDYAQNYFKYTGTKNKNQEEFLEILGKIIEERLGKNTADSAMRQLQKCPVISTAEHHSPLAHIFFLNSNLISAMPLYESTDPEMENLIVLSFSSPSLSNDSGYSRGIVWTETNKKKKINIFLEKEKNLPIYSTRAFTMADLERASAEADTRMRGILQKYFTPEAGKANLCEQITSINYKLWPDIVRHEKKVNLIYIEIESVVREILLRRMNDPLIQKLISEVIEMPFWEVKDGHRKKSSVIGTAEIESKLRERTIFPSMPLCYAIVAFYSGIKCLGGFCQVNDLTALKETWEKHFGQTDIDTKAFGGDGLQIVPAYGLDLVDNPLSIKSVIEKAKKITLWKAIEPMLTEIRKVLY